MIRRKQKNQEIWLDEFDRHIQENLSNEFFTTVELASLMHCSKRQLQRKFKDYTGDSPIQYLKESRLKKAYEYLEEGAFPTVKETALAVGFRDPVYFSRQFKQRFGMLPSEV